MLLLEKGNYLTATPLRRQIRGTRIVETTYTAGERLPLHSHAGPYMVVMIDGCLRETALGREYDLCRGWIVVNTSGESHRDLVIAPGTRCLNIELDTIAPQFEREGLRPPQTVHYARITTALGAVGRLYSAVARGTADSLDAEEAITDLLSDVLCDRPQPSKAPAWLARTIDYLHANFRSGVTLAELAGVAGVHRVHLCRAFANAVGCTVGQYARLLRDDEAHRQLTVTCSGLAQAAADCGFADQSHMTRELRARYGATPGRLRRR